MLVLDLFKLSTRMFKTRPLRTFLTVAGMGVGIGAVLFLVSLGYGMQNIILKRVVQSDSLLSLAVSPHSENIILDSDMVQKLKELPKVQDVATLSSFTGQVVVGELTGNTTIRVVDSSFFNYAGIVAREGALFGKEDQDNIVVSDAFLRLFNVGSLDTVKTTDITFHVFVPVKNALGGEEINEVNIDRVFHVVGVVEDSQNSYVYLPSSAIGSRIPVDHYDQAMVRGASTEDLEGITNAIITQGLQVASISDVVAQAKKIFSIVQIVLGLFGAISLIVATIGMFNTMTVTMLERINEIGIMRAIGASKRDIKFIFLLEAAIIGFLGGVAGVVIGQGIGFLINAGVNLLASRLGGAGVKLFETPIWFSIGILAFSSLIGYCAALVPARRGARMHPLDALKYK